MKIDKEFQTIFPQLTNEQYLELEESILRHGCLDPLKTWNGILIDGHNRYSICIKHRIPYEIREMQFNSKLDVKIWLIENQVCRRKLNTAQRCEIVLRLEKEMEKYKEVRNENR